MKSPTHNASAEKTPCYSISTLTRMIQNQLESGFPPLWVKGELSNFTAHSSGHWYFTLKDSDAQLRAVMFRFANAKVSFRPKAGMEVKAFGKITVYGARGEYQIVCEGLEECGRGALQEEFERIKQKLKAEGVFERSLALPLFPRHIGIISSPTGAAIQDILNILRRRARGVKVTLVPALVQGEQAEASLLQALSQVERIKDLDLLIITRGGGSLEDLWAFNSEKLARRVAAFPKPVISAVGHEVDFSICDFASDLRAPTPSAAAELATQNSSEWIQKIHKIKHQLWQQMQREIHYIRQRLQRLVQTLVNPQKKLEDLMQKTDDLKRRLELCGLKSVELKKQQFQHLKGLLQSYSPLKVLNRGYTVIQKNGKTISEVRNLKAGDAVQIQFARGRAFAQITKVHLKSH